MPSTPPEPFFAYRPAVQSGAGMLKQCTLRGPESPHTVSTRAMHATLVIIMRPTLSCRISSHVEETTESLAMLDLSMCTAPRCFAWCSKWATACVERRGSPALGPASVQFRYRGLPGNLRAPQTCPQYLAWPGGRTVRTNARMRAWTRHALRGPRARPRPALPRCFTSAEARSSPRTSLSWSAVSRTSVVTYDISLPGVGAQQSGGHTARSRAARSARSARLLKSHVWPLGPPAPT
jgi:hypothetical protein